MNRPPTVGERARGLLQLLRPANVATSLADVLAGAAVSGLLISPALVTLLLATMALYAGGIVLNDYFDRAIDARERPERPIPSGRVPPRVAASLGGGLLLAGIGAASLAGTVPALVAMATALAVLSYDSWGKHQVFLGPINMGLCRALNLMLGMSAVAGAIPAYWPLGLIPLTYISAVTVVSRGEVHGSKRPVALLGLALVTAVVLALAVLAWSPWPPPAARPPAASVVWALGLTAWLGWRVLPAFWRAWTDPSPGPIRNAVRTGVLALVLVDSVIATAYAGMIYGLAVLAAGLLAWLLARLFAVT
jgi:4-hydroxybenzoate polyprenyltransferase